MYAQLAAARRDAGISQAQLAETIGIAQPSVSGYERGRTTLSRDTLIRYAQAVGLDPGTLGLLDGTQRPTASAPMASSKPPRSVEAPPDTPPRLRMVPLLGTVSAGIPISAAEVREGEVPVDPARLQGDQGFALRVRGNSMNKAQIDDGDVVIVRMTPFVAPGDKVVALIDDEDATVKRLVEGPDGLMLRADSTTPYEPIPFDPMRVRILGKVVGAYTPSK